MKWVVVICCVGELVLCVCVCVRVWACAFVRVRLCVWCVVGRAEFGWPVLG